MIQVSCNIFAQYQFLCLCFLYVIELPFKRAKEMQRISYDKWDESLKDLIYN